MTHLSPRCMYRSYNAALDDWKKYRFFDNMKNYSA
jgi:hypothetical protein